MTTTNHKLYFVYKIKKNDKNENLSGLQPGKIYEDKERAKNMVKLLNEEEAAASGNEHFKPWMVVSIEHVTQKRCDFYCQSRYCCKQSWF